MCKILEIMSILTLECSNSLRFVGTYSTPPIFAMYLSVASISLNFPWKSSVSKFQVRVLTLLWSHVGLSGNTKRMMKIEGMATSVQTRTDWRQLGNHMQIRVRSSRPYPWKCRKFHSFLTIIYSLNMIFKKQKRLKGIEIGRFFSKSLEKVRVRGSKI